MRPGLSLSGREALPLSALNESKPKNSAGGAFGIGQSLRHGRARDGKRVGQVGQLVFLSRVFVKVESTPRAQRAAGATSPPAHSPEDMIGL